MNNNVLLTNFNILNYSGSEIDTVTIANYFIKKGYNVDIFTLEYGNPIKKQLNEKINIITPNDTTKLQINYDIIWAHHYPLLDYLIFSKKVKANHIVYISLSAFEPLEMLPFYCNNLSVIGVLSEETRNINQTLTKKKLILFPNYAPNIYFKNKIKKVQKISNICIVSNHVPNELYDFSKIAVSNGINVDIYGLNNIINFVDNNVLSKYDLIISIGKTIYYGLAMGKICYCYDKFGGYEFITLENIDKAFSNNFSGREFGKKLTGQEIYNNIVDNFQIVNNDLKKLKEYAYEHFHFEKNIEKILSYLNESNTVNYDKIFKKYPDLIIKSKLYVEDINHKNNIINILKTENLNLINTLNNKENILKKVIKRILRLKNRNK